MSHENSVTIDIDGRWYNVREHDQGLPLDQLMERVLGGPFPDVDTAVAAAKQRSDTTVARLVAEVKDRGSDIAGKVAVKPKRVVDTNKSGDLWSQEATLSENGEGRDLGTLVRFGSDDQLEALASSSNPLAQTAAKRELEFRQSFTQTVSKLSPEERAELRDALLVDEQQILDSTTGKHVKRERWVGGGDAIGEIIAAFDIAKPAAASQSPLTMPPLDKPAAPAPVPLPGVEAVFDALSAAPKTEGGRIKRPAMPAGGAGTVPGAGGVGIERGQMPVGGPGSVPPGLASGLVRPQPQLVGGAAVPNQPGTGMAPLTGTGTLDRAIGTVAEPVVLSGTGTNAPGLGTVPGPRDALARHPGPQPAQSPEFMAGGTPLPDPTQPPGGIGRPAYETQRWPGPYGAGDREAMDELIFRTLGGGQVPPGGTWEEIEAGMRMRGGLSPRSAEPIPGVEKLFEQPEALPGVEMLFDRDGTAISRVLDEALAGGKQWIDAYTPQLEPTGDNVYDAFITNPVNGLAALFHGFMAVAGAGAAGAIQIGNEAGIIKEDPQDAAEEPFFWSEPFGFGVMRIKPGAKLPPGSSPKAPVPPSAPAAPTISAAVQSYRGSLDTYRQLVTQRALDKEFKQLIPEGVRPDKLPVGQSWRELARQYLVARRLELGDRIRMPQERGVATTPGPLGPERQIAAQPSTAGILPDELAAIERYRETGDVVDLAGVRMTPQVRAVLEAPKPSGGAKSPRRYTLPEGDRRVIVGALEKPVEPSVALRYVEAQAARMAEEAATKIVAARRGGRKPRTSAAAAKATKAETTAQLKKEVAASTEKEIVKAQLRGAADRVIAKSLKEAETAAPPIIAKASGVARVQLSPAERQVNRALQTVKIEDTALAARLEKMPVSERMVAMLQSDTVGEATAAILGRRARTRNAVAELFSMVDC